MEIVLEYEQVIREPPRFVPQPDMEVINRWPDAWNKHIPLMRQWPRALLGWQTGDRPFASPPPPINKMASRWFDYPGYAQGSQGWHNQRFHNIISGSRVGTMLGNNRYQSADELFEQMVGRMPNDPVNADMIRGTKYEPVAMDCYAKEKGWVLLDMPLIHHQREEYRLLVVSLDRLFAGCVDGTMQDELILVECKCPRKISSDKVTFYMDQMQLQMEVATSHIEAEEKRNECVNYLVQYRDATWSGSGMWELNETRVPRDPDWLNQSYPRLLNFDQRVRAHREQEGVTMEFYNKINRTSSDFYHTLMIHLLNEGAMEEREIKNVCQREMVYHHQRAFDEHRTQRLFR